jgi:hypothetical protein
MSGPAEGEHEGSTEHSHEPAHAGELWGSQGKQSEPAMAAEKGAEKPYVVWSSAPQSFSPSPSYSSGPSTDGPAHAASAPSYSAPEAPSSDHSPEGSSPGSHE